MSTKVGRVEELNAEQVKETFGYVIENNLSLAERGKMPISVGLEGHSGIGKTSVLEQLAKEKKMAFLKLNLSQISVEDFIGYPISEFFMCKEGVITHDSEGKKLKDPQPHCIWVSERVLANYQGLGYEYQGKNRMGYAAPKWIEGQTEPMILLLDDFNRGSLGMLQAAMEIVDKQEYVSWRLPKGSTVILSNNPDDGEYFVSTQDTAHATRYLNFHMKFDVDTWAMWAEGANIDSRCINFLLKNPEIVTGTKDFDDKGQKLKKANVRLWTKFFDTISGIPDFQNSLGRVMLMGGGSIPQEHMLLFSQFINQKLDKLLTPTEMLNGDEKKVIKELQDLIGKGDKKRQDLSSILSKRLMNYCVANESELTKDNVERFAKILEADIFAKDIIHLITRKLVNIQKLKTLIHRPKLLDYYK